MNQPTELIFNKLVKYLLYIAFYSKEKSMSQSVSERTRIKSDRYESGVILTLRWVTGMHHTQ
jgi:hypothetical protein